MPLVGITYGRLAIWLNPFGMLEPQIVVNLFPKVGIRKDLLRHSYWLSERFRVPLNSLRSSRTPEKSTSDDGYEGVATATSGDEP